MVLHVSVSGLAGFCYGNTKELTAVVEGACSLASRYKRPPIGKGHKGTQEGDSQYPREICHTLS